MSAFHASSEGSISKCLRFRCVIKAQRQASAAGSVLFHFRGDSVADLSERAEFVALFEIANGRRLPTKHHCLIEPEVCIEHPCLSAIKGCGSTIVPKFTLPRPPSKQKPGVKTKNTRDRA